MYPLSTYLQFYNQTLILTKGSLHKNTETEYYSKTYINENDNRTLGSMNLKRGLTRMVFSVFVLWVALIASVFPFMIDRARSYGYGDNAIRIITTSRIFPFLGLALLPPLAVYFSIGLIVWIVRGFKKDRPLGK